MFVLSTNSFQDSRIQAYSTLSQGSLLLSDLPAKVRKKLPRSPQAAVSLLVDQSCRGQKLGELMLMDALRRVWIASKQVAAYALVVDVLQVEPDPLSFYLRYDFEPLPEQPRRLYLPLQRYQELFT